MKHAVVIPLYNKQPYVADAITSLAKQIKKPDEIIVVDDASNDGSLKRVQETFSTYACDFADTVVRVIKLPENCGPGNARNIGLLHVTAELVSFLDADDIYHPELLDKAAKYMLSERVDFLVVGLLMMPSGINYPDTFALRLLIEPVNEELYLIPDALFAVSSPDFIMGLGSNVIVRRRWLERHRYEQKALLNEGIDFWYRVLKSVVSESDSKIALLNGSYIQIREVNGSLSRKEYSHWKELKIPPSLVRFKNSKDKYDQQLTGMICQRWYEYAMEVLPYTQRVLFLLNHGATLWQNRKYRNQRKYL